jgi:MFS family permease
LSALGAIVGTISGALLGSWIGRRITYSLLCIGSLGSALLLYWSAIARLLMETTGLHRLGEAMATYPINAAYGPLFLFSVFVAGLTTAAFYGWLPLYLPELFRPAVRATGQGFSYNFGRGVGALFPSVIGFLAASMPLGRAIGIFAASAYALLFLAAVLLPETRGRELAAVA